MRSHFHRINALIFLAYFICTALLEQHARKKVHTLITYPHSSNDVGSSPQKPTAESGQPLLFVQRFCRVYKPAVGRLLQVPLLTSFNYVKRMRYQSSPRPTHHACGITGSMCSHLKLPLEVSLQNWCESEHTRHVYTFPAKTRSKASEYPTQTPTILLHHLPHDMKCAGPVSVIGSLDS